MKYTYYYSKWTHGSIEFVPVVMAAIVLLGTELFDVLDVTHKNHPKHKIVTVWVKAIQKSYLLKNNCKRMNQDNRQTRCTLYD